LAAVPARLLTDSGWHVEETIIGFALAVCSSSCDSVVADEIEAHITISPRIDAELKAWEARAALCAPPDLLGASMCKFSHSFQSLHLTDPSIQATQAKNALQKPQKVRIRKDTTVYGVVTYRTGKKTTVDRHWAASEHYLCKLATLNSLFSYTHGE
jgi:hypothetical protein